MTALEDLRTLDRDRYIATLFLPEEKQQDVATLLCFAAEIARIPKLVKEPQMGEIRLQWWVDTLETLTREDTQDHPLALSLSHVVKDHDLPVAPLVHMVEARRFDLYADQMPDLEALETYLGETESAVFQLVALVIGATAARNASEASGLSGVAFGMARLLAAQSAKHIPSRFDARAHCSNRLDEGRNAVNALPAELRAVFLPLALTDLYLRNKATPLRKQWRMWRTARRGRF